MRRARDKLVSKLGENGNTRAARSLTHGNGLAPSPIETRILILVLGSTTTVNRTTVLVVTAVTAPETKEAENARAQGW
jgi:hypothetical protein